MSAPYEEPEDAEILVKSGETGVKEAVVQIVKYLEATDLLWKGGRSQANEDN